MTKGGQHSNCKHLIKNHHSLGLLGLKLQQGGN